MTRVTLAPDGTHAAAPPASSRLPHRARLHRPALEHLAVLTGTPLPWDRRPDGAPGDATGRAAGELERLGLLTPRGTVLPGLVDAMRVLAAPEVLVDLDVSVRRAAAARGFVQLHAWHRWGAGRVTALATAGSCFELAWLGDDLWQVELARAVTLRAPTAARPSTAPVVHVPHALLLGTGEALRRQRADLFGELVRRHAAEVRVDPAGTDPHDQLRILHTGALGRLRAVVSGPGPCGTRRAGWVGWVLFPDGWRAFSPYTRRGVPMVRVHAVEPLRLGVEVARLVTAVRR